MRTAISAGLCFCLLTFMGCGDDGPPTGSISGVVKIGGKPPTEQLRIHFFNSTTGAGSQGLIGEDGVYELTSEVLVGEYNVYFSKWLDPAKMQGAVSTAEETATSVPVNYRSETGTPLKKQVEEGANTIDIEIPSE